MGSQPRWLKAALQLAISLLLFYSPASQAEPTEPVNSESVAAKPDRGLVGNVEAGHYIARDKSFSFKLPINGSPRALKEAITDTLSRGTQLIAIKSPSDSSNYRFEVSKVLPGDKKNNSHFTQATSKTFDWYRRLIQRSWRAPITQIVNEEFTWNDHPAAHAIFKQFADATSGPRYHVFYLADFGNNVILLWTNISLPEENLEEEDRIIAASSGPALKAKQSFFSFRFD